ncbi:MAG: hypothetical protein ACKODX_22300 [Gemmata sp.]
MYRLGLVFVCLLGGGAARAASPNPADLEATPEVQVKARALVRQLGSADFAEREEAAERLAKLGRFARPALTAGATSHPDPEIRFRCNQLLPRAANLDRTAKLETFLADTKGEYEHNLPAWNRFRAAVGHEWDVLGYRIWTNRELDAAARKVFTDLVSTEANRKLLMLADGSRVYLSDAVVWRRQELYDQRDARDEIARTDLLTLDDVTALLFAESLVGSSYVSGRRTSASSLLSGCGFYAAARKGDARAKVLRAVAGAWLDSRNEAREMYSGIGIATGLDLPEHACALAARMLTTPAIAPAWRTRGVGHLSSYGSRKHVNLLDPALADTFVVYAIPRPAPVGEPEPVPYQVQVRDVALGLALHLTEQKPEDYGFVDLYGAGAGPEQRRPFSYARHYFPDGATRTAALEKWAKWRKANPG